MKTLNSLAGLVLSSQLTLTPLFAQTKSIDFETLPSGQPPVEGMSISNQFQASMGISFAFENGTFPVIAKVGGTTPDAFKYNGLTNTPAPNQNLSRFFLTDDGTIDTPPPALIISFATPKAACSGVILDIDGNPTEHYEAWDIFARDANSNIIATVHLSTNSPNAGDGKATPWSFRRPTLDIASVRIAYSTANGRTSRVGLAFDNFSPDTAITPVKLKLTKVASGLRISVAGIFGSTNRIEWSASLPSTNWLTAGTVVLTNAPEQFLTNTAPASITNLYFRSVSVP